jgi:hypothetical protein
MSSDVRAVQDVLAALTPKMKGFSQSLLAQDTGNSLYGLQGVDDGVERVHIGASARAL